MADKADIYLIVCNPTGLKYVGVAKHFKGTANTNWGYVNRWKSHIYDAITEVKHDQNCSVLHKAIIAHGKDAFEVTKIRECLVDEMYDLEKHYIAEYNTIFPNGYNMTTGGKVTEHCEEAKKNMSLGQIGKRYAPKTERKNPEDNDLPQHILAIRKNGKIKGYQVKKFPIGVDEVEYVHKTFKRFDNLPSALEEAKVYLEELKVLYAKRLEVKKKETEMQALSIKIMIPTLPEYIYPIIENEELSGFYVKNMKNVEGKLIPRQDFENIPAALTYIKDVNEIIADNKAIQPTTSNVQDLPANIYKSTYKGIHNGYRVKLLTGYNDEKGKKKPIYAEKNFTGPNKTMPEKLQLAIEYIESINLN